MSYSLTKEQESLRQKVRKLTAEVIAPGENDREKNDVFPWDMIKALHDNGLWQAGYPKEYGGTNATLMEICLIAEELSWYSNNLSTLISGNRMMALIFEEAATPEQKKKYLVPAAAGKMITGNGITEAGGGTDLAGMLTTAVRDGDDYIVNGKKRFISYAHACDAFLVYCKTDPTKGNNGISIILFDCPRGKKVPGFSITRRMPIMGLLSTGACELSFENVRIPRRNLLGKENEGLNYLKKILDPGRIIVAARSVGTAASALNYALEYARKRMAFGQPISSFQGLRFMLSDMATETEAARQLTYTAANEADRKGPKVGIYSSMAKMFASDVAMRVTTDAVQVLGGQGYTSDHPVERLMREAKSLQIVEGTNQIHRALIAKRMIGSSREKC